MSSRPSGVAIADGAEVPQPFASAMDHLQSELGWLRLVLQREILRLKAANLLSADPFRGLYLADEQVDAILRDWNAEQRRPPAPGLADVSLRAAMKRVEIDARLRECVAAGIPPPMMRLADMFGLSVFECNVLVAVLALEMDLRFEALYSWARNDVTRKSPSVDLVLKLFCEDSADRLRCRQAFRLDGSLFRNRLLRVSEDQQERDPSFFGRSLRLDERIAAFLLDQEGIDHRLEPFTTFSVPSRAFASLYLPERLRVQLRNAGQMHDDLILYLCGPRGAGKGSAVEALCSDVHRPLLTVDLSRVAGFHLAPQEAFALLQREAILSGADLFLEHAEALITENSVVDPVGAALERLQPVPGVRIFITGEAPWPNTGWRKCAWRSFDFPVPSFSDRAKLWQEALRTHGAAHVPDIDVELLANRFALTGGAIHQACAEMVQGMEIRDGSEGGPASRDLEAAARAQSTHGLRRFAQKVHARASWDSLVLPPRILRQLHDVCTAERHRHTVYIRWGFDERLTSGKGLNVLFCGSSGTGKTMAAGVLAGELGLDLYRIDLSIVVSKYIGETEKQLSLIFREAKTSNAVLFFDEADALFGKRSEVKDAHDRYANVETAYLLQKMEEYEGIVILATNLRRNMDDAFTRRMGHIIDFPFPDAEHRERIWKKILPPSAPVANDLDFGFLARQFELAGGNIRNIALASAFLAAEEGAAIRMEHCIVATALEMQKTGKLPSRAEFRDYYDLIRSHV